MPVKQRKNKKNNNDNQSLQNNSKQQSNKSNKQSNKSKKKQKNNQQTKRNWIYRLFDEEDNLTLIIFRIMWGIIMTYECYTFIRRDYAKLNSYYVIPEFHPKYYGFFWVHPWPGDGMYYHIWTMFISGCGVTIGFLYHINCFIFFLGFTYIILLDACMYLNHFYLIAVMAFMLILLPAYKRFSVDAYLFPSLRSNTMPKYVLYLLRFTQVIVYFYAGIAKINEDWLRGEPTRHWIGNRALNSFDPTSYIGYYIPLFLASEAGVYFIAIGGLVFDLCAGFFLCFGKGMLFYFTLLNCVFFHLMNKFLMNIGIFPWVMLASTPLFFNSDWAYKIPYVTKFIKPTSTKIYTGKLTLTKKIVLVILLLFALHQVLTPIRHHFYYDNVAWNEMGHRYSWRMKLRDKVCDGELILHDPSTDAKYQVNFESYLYGKQVRKVKPRPELLIQFAHYIAGLYENQTNIYPKVYTNLQCSLNYRKPQPMFLEGVDLASVDSYDWGSFDKIITPLQPLTEEDKKYSILNWSKIQSLLTNPFEIINLNNDRVKYK